MMAVAEGFVGVAVPARPAAGHGRLAAVEPHRRCERDLQPDPARGRLVVHRRRQANTWRASDARSRTSLGRPTLMFNVPSAYDALDPADASRMPDFAETSVVRHGPPALRRRRPAAEPVGSSRASFVDRRARRAHSHRLLARLDRNGVAGNARTVGHRRLRFAGLPIPGIEAKLIKVIDDDMEVRFAATTSRPVTGMQPEATQCIRRRRLSENRRCRAASPILQDMSQASPITDACRRTSS